MKRHVYQKKKKNKKKNQRIIASSQWSFKVYTKDII